MMPIRSVPILLCAALLFTIGSVAAVAAVIHLKNGATITADSWERQGEDLVIRQRDGTIVVPMAEVLRIESGPESEDTPAPLIVEVQSTPGALRKPGSKPLKEMKPEEIQNRIDDLKRRLRVEPLHRDQRTRRVVELLNHLGSRGYRSRDLDAAVARFREALEYDRQNASAQLGLAASYFAQGQDIYARSTLEQALLHHPTDPSLLLLLGDVYYSQERPEDALETWEKSQSFRPGEAIRQRIEKLRREHKIEGAYERSDAAHFTLKYDGVQAGADLGDQILQYLEDEFSTMVNRFDYYPRQPLVVIVYPQKQFYEATLAEKNVGGLFDGKIRVPIAGLRSLDHAARNVLIHELTHAFVSGKSGGAAPRWLQEGLAQHIEGRTTPRHVGRALAEEYRSLQGADSWGTGFSYPSALSFVEYLVRQEGLFRILDALEALAGGTGVEAAFEGATRYTMKELRQSWGDSLAREHLH